jgi:redox-sensing transcriptional repressor
VHVGISNKAVSRLSPYRSALLRFKAYGTVKIFSCDLAETLGLTAAQVRKDFSMFRFAGKKKVGYDVNQLIKNIDNLLQKNCSNTAVLCGTGTSGSAFFISQLLSAQGLAIAAAFDDHDRFPSAKIIDPGVPVLPIGKLINYVAENSIKFGIIAAPLKDAQRMLDMLVMAGIKGVLNLTGAEIKAPKQCIINTVSVVREFEKIVYFVNNHPDGKGTAC